MLNFINVILVDDWQFTCHCGFFHQNLTSISCIFLAVTQNRTFENETKEHDLTHSPNVIGTKWYLQIFEDVSGILDSFLDLRGSQRIENKDIIAFIENESMSNKKRLVICDSYPARNSTLVLIQALDLGQVLGGGALHLKTLLWMKDSQRVRCGFWHICAAS